MAEVPVDDSIEHIFEHVVESCKFWIKILTASGKCVDGIRKHPKVKLVERTIENIIHRINHFYISARFLLRLKNKESDALQLLQCREGSNCKIEKELDKCQKQFAAYQENINTVECTFKAMKNSPVSHLVKETLDYISRRKKDINQGEVAVDEFFKSSNEVRSIQELAKCCDRIKDVVSTHVFWNLNADYFDIGTICQDETDTMQEENVLDEIALPRLFNEDLLGPKPIQFRSVLKTVEFLTRDCLKRYEHVWKTFEKEDNQSVIEMRKIFRGVEDIENEIGQAEKSCILRLNSVSRKCLIQFANLKLYTKTVDTIKIASRAFKFDFKQDSHYRDTVHKFEQLLNDQLEGVTLKEIKPALQNIDEVHSVIGPDLQNVLYAVQKSTELINFLREVIDDDIRNLIDAVEEHSEQYVRESTVSDLIEVKQFFKPVLKGNFTTNVGGFFELLQKQINHTDANRITEKIFVCRDHLHSLRALYRNVANRGERTVEVIENIMQKGMFNFSLNPKRCEVSVEYKMRKRYNYTDADLSDLRSRALLVMNKEEKDKNRSKSVKKANLEKFVETVDYAFEIADLCMLLKQAGHFSFSRYNEVCSHEALPDLKNGLKNEYNQWHKQIKACRHQFYYLNYLYSDQLYELYSFLNKDKKNESIVISVLRFIDPSIEDLQQMAKIYKDFPTNDNHMTALENIGKTLDKLCENPKPKYVQNSETRVFVKMTDKVQPGIPYIIALSEESPLAIRTLLALYINTIGALPETHQILFCRNDTTYEEISLLLNRCLWKKPSSPPALFTVANIEMLSGDVQFQLHDAIRRIPPGGCYLLCFICRGHAHHSFLDQFADMLFRPTPLSDLQMKSLFLEHWSHVKVVTSEVPGLGKSEYIQRQAICERKRPKTIHVSGHISKILIIEELIKLRLQKYNVLHIDVGIVADPLALDLILFELIVLRYLSSGSTAYALTCDYVYIEIANTVKHVLCNSLPTVMCFTREHLYWNSYEDLRVSSEINSPMQVVCHYLKALDEGIIDLKDLYFTGPDCLKPLTGRECGRILSSHFRAVKDMSFTLMNILLGVLADQLKKLSASVFFRCKNLSDMLGQGTITSVKSNLVRALINVSLDFSSRSIHTCRSTQAASFVGDTREDTASLLARRVSGMIRWEDNNHLVILFHQNMQTVSALYRNVNDIPRSIVDLFESQVKTKLTEFKDKKSDELKALLVMLTRFKCTSADDEFLCQLMKHYALTADNLLKMVLISLRVSAKVPVVIMGETGCGKTSLIRFLARVCGITFEVFNIHAGITESDILQKLDNANKNALSKVTDQIWLFLDEINTCDHLGLIASALCHRVLHGKEVAPNLILLAACNPYRLRTAETISTTGLQGKLRTDELSRLVYRVHPLPENLIDFVWDFGSLSDNDEVSYITKMVDKLFDEAWVTNLLADVLAMSQRFVRTIETNDYCVSLRDVDRCRRLTKWFDSFIYERNINTSKTDRHVKAIILGLSVCYHCRFSLGDVRQKYRKKVVKCFLRSSYEISESEIQDIILSEQKYILGKMTDFPTGTALNAALQENVFMLLVCILNKIPIFLVGKPGCSKSLSMQLIRSNLRGKDSTDPLFQEMPQLFCVAFQGSESSTSDGIITVFEKAEKYQNHNDEKDILSVVILDEIGLAEISRFNPLKVLHGLIEPDGQELKVAVVGISNWALDAAKMNRAIYLSRPDMNLEELIYTGHSISSGMLKREEGTDTFYTTETIQFDPQESGYAALIDGIANAYYVYCTETQKFANFHGLRDFYSLIKYVRLKAETMQDANTEEFGDIILMGILRNFGGLPTEKEHILDIFRKHIPQVSPRQIPITQLVKENILDKSSRHLMLITNGDAVLSVLESQLSDIGTPFDIIFGSSFDDDLSDDYNYRILSRIILCMEQGMVLILKDLESIYGSLYDMLNQNYTIVGKKKNCRIALGQYSNPMCHVHDDFKCIVLVEESKLDYSDPPFLNRFEKQHFKFEDLLHDKQLKDIVNEMNDEVRNMCQVPNHCFLPCDVIPTYCQHLLLSLIIHSAREFDSSFSKDSIKRYAFETLIWFFPPEVVIRSAESVLSRSRKANDVGLLINKYMALPIHRGIWSYIDYLRKLSSHTGRLKKCNIDSEKYVSSNAMIKNKESLDIQTMEGLPADDSLNKSSMSLDKNYTANTHIIQNDLESNFLSKSYVDSFDLQDETDKVEDVLVNKLSSASMMLSINFDENADNLMLHTKSDTALTTSHETLDCSEYDKELQNTASCIPLLERTTNDVLSKQINHDKEHLLVMDAYRTGSACNQKQLNTEQSMEQSRSVLLYEHLSFVYTFAGINSVIEQDLSGQTFQKEKIAVFKSEKQFSMKVEEFLNSNIDILLIQCLASTDRQHLLLTKVIVEKCIRKRKRLLSDFDKYICIIIHLERQSNIEIPLNFLSGWRLVFLDSIEEPKTQLKHFLDVEQLQIVKERMPLHNYIKDSLFWVFSRIKFTAKQNSVELLEIILAHIKSCTCAIETLEKCIISWIEKKKSVDLNLLDMNDMNIGKFFSSTWCVNIAKTPHELLKSGTFVGALENNIQEVIKVPLAIHLFQLMRLNMLSSVFVEDEFSATRRLVWTKTVLSEQCMHTEEIPAPTGPECYCCEVEFMNLHMPYSQMIMHHLEARKDEYLDIIRRLRIANEIEPDDEIPPDLFYSATDDCMDILCYDIVEIAEDLDYPGRNNDFIRDFCNFNSLTFLEALEEEDRISILKWALSNFIDVDKLALGNFLRLVASLHSALWVYEHVVIAICEMIKLTAPFTDVFLPSSSEQILPMTVNSSTIYSNYDNQRLVLNSSFDSTTDNEMSLRISLNYEDLPSPFMSRKEIDNFSISNIYEGESTNVSDEDNQCQTVLYSRCDFEPSRANENVIDVNSCDEPAKCYLQEDIPQEDGYNMRNTSASLKKDDLISNTQIPTNSFSTMTNQLERHKKSCCFSNLSREHLVRIVCLSLFPTQQILSQQPLNDWLSQIVRILPLAYIVHDESYELSGLKFFQEFLETFVANNIIQNNAVAKFGDCLRNADGIIDSIEVCETLFAILKDLEINNLVSKQVMQRLFCSYISRCVISNPENSQPLEFALEKICKAEMFDECLSCFGQVIRFAIIIDLGDNPNGFLNILADGKHHETHDYPCFARCFNTCLIEQNSKIQTDHPFANLLVHSIEECAFEGCLTVDQLEVTDTSSNDTFSWLSVSLYVVKQGCFSLKTVIAVAYIRKFIKLAVDLLESRQYNCGKITLTCQHINSTMSTPEVLHLFLKCIDQKTGQQYIEKICRMLEPFVPVLKGTSWNLHFVELSPVFNPLFLHIEKDSFYLYCLQVMTVGQKNNTLHDLLLVEKGEIRTLSVLAQTFYMNKCLKEKDDSELQLSTHIAEIVSQTHLSVEFKHIVALLLGTKDFEHSIFKLSVMVESPQAQIVSVMIHMIGLTCTAACRANIWYQTLMTPSNLTKTVWPIFKCDSVSAASFEFSTVSIYCMQILLYSCLISSIGLGTASVNQLASGIGCDEVNLHEELESQLYMYWKKLKTVLQLSYNDICILLHNILSKLAPLLHIEYDASIDIDFTKQHVEIIENCLANRIVIIHKTKQVFSTLFQDDSLTMEKCVTEIQPCNSGNKQMIETLLAMANGLPSKDMFLADLHLGKYEFSLLKLVLDKVQSLSLPQKILSFMKWHLSLVTYASYKFRKVDFKELTVAKLLTLEHDDKRRQLLKNAFDAFKNDWNIIRSDYAGHLCFEGLELMHPNLKMEFTAIFGEEPIVHKVLKALINMQNSFLQAVCSMSKTDGTLKVANVTFREVSLLNVKSRDLLRFEWNDKWLHFSQCDTRYGLGQKICYDFEKIEQEIKREVLFGKCIIQIPVLPKIIFLDDLFQNSIELLKEIALIVPQNQIHIDIKKDIEKKTERDASKIISHLTSIGMMLSFIRKTGAQAEHSILEYIANWENITGISAVEQKFMFSNDMKLGHIVALYNLLEELNGKNIVHFLEDKYRKPLSQGLKDVLYSSKFQYAKIYEKLDHAIKVFIHRCLSSTDNVINVEQPLIDYLSDVDFWWTNDIKQELIYDDQTSVALKQVLSPLILVENICDTVQCLQNVVEDSKQRDVRISGITATYQHTRPKEQPSRTRIKTAKKLMRI